jgi:mannan endo-1,6-alpha-mannosidase
MEIVQNLLYSEVTGPATEQAGGISANNPDAGVDAPNVPKHFDSINACDQAGAIVFTLIILVMTLAGGWWLVL